MSVNRVSWYSEINDCHDNQVSEAHHKSSFHTLRAGGSYRIIPGMCIVGHVFQSVHIFD